MANSSPNLLKTVLSVTFVFPAQDNVEQHFVHPLLAFAGGFVIDAFLNSLLGIAFD
jgi:hypothetical protein